MNRKMEYCDISHWQSTKICFKGGLTFSVWGIKSWNFQDQLDIVLGSLCINENILRHNVMTLPYFFINNYYFLCLWVGICYTKLCRKEQLILDFLIIFSRQILGLSKVPSIFKRIFLICISHEEQYLGDPLSIVFFSCVWV